MLPATFLATVGALDERALVWLNQFAFRWPLLDLFAAWIVDARLVKFLPLLLVLIGFWFAPSPRQVRHRQIVLEGVVTGFAAIVIGRVLALALPFRDRPLADDTLGLTFPHEAELRTWSSFPSDHAVMAFALAATLWRLSRPFGVWAFLHAALVVCLPRVYFGWHWPSDVVGGALIGVGLAVAVALLPARTALAAPAFAVERRWPWVFYPLAYVALFEIAEMFDSVRIVATNVFRVLRQLAG